MNQSKIEALNGSFTILKYFEARYTCSGLCDPALFYYSLDMSEGVPMKSCLLYMKQEISNSLIALGIFACVTGFIMSVLWCM
jgi:hypothetical protein